MENSSLGNILTMIADGSLRNGTIITNKDTGERVIINEGSLHFLTINNYISNEVPLVRGMIDATWEIQADPYENVHLYEVFDYLVKGVEVIVQEPRVKPDPEADSDWRDLGTVSTVEDFLLLFSGFEYFVDDLSSLSYLIKQKDMDKPKGSRKTTETDAWAILMDRYIHMFPVKEIAGKFDISLRNAYYIVDGTYYPDVFERFNRLLEKGELE